MSKYATQTLPPGIKRPRPAKAGSEPWAWLDEWRGKAFQGEWPSLPQLFSITTRRFPERACYTVYEPDRVSLTFSQSLERINALAAWLHHSGVQAGDRVAVCGKNSPEWAISYLATLFADAVVVPIDATLSGGEIANLLRASGAVAFLADPDRQNSISEVPANFRLRASLERGAALPYVYDLADGAAAQTLPTPQRGGKDLAAILYTSGTTGNPKGVMLSHENLVSDAFLAQYHMPIYSTDVFYALLPIHHSYTMLAVFIESFAVGAEVVFGKKMVVNQILSDLKQARVTMFLGVPLLFNKLIAGIMKGVRAKGPIVYGIIRLLMAISGIIKKITGANPGKKLFHSVLAKASLDSIRICISGGGPLPASTFRQYNQLGIDFVQGYGLTETSPIIALNPVWHYKVSSVGAVVPHTDLHILDPDAEGRGEIIVKGPMVMGGYYNNPEATAAVFTTDGYLKTGDVGWLDAENYLYLTGRAKNLIVTEGGKNVFPEEIENEFQLYGEIEQVLVRGYLADARTRSEEIEVVLYPNQESFKQADGSADKQGIAKRLNDIVTEVNRRLHAHQKIQKVTVVDQPMDMTSTKKIKRFTVK